MRHLHHSSLSFWGFLCLLYAPLAMHAMPIELKAEGKKCPADFHSAHKHRMKGGLLVLTDKDQAIYEPKLIKPLQMNLPKFNWATLTLASSSKKETNTQCLMEAVKYLQTHEAEPVFVAAVGHSYVDAMEYFIEKQPPGVYGLILLSPFPYMDKKYQKPIKNWVEIRLPMLIIYNQRDYKPVLNTVHALKTAHTAEGNELLRLKQIMAGTPGSVSYNHGIAKQIASWLHFVKTRINFVARKKANE